MKGTKRKIGISLWGLSIAFWAVLFACGDDNEAKEYDPNLAVKISDVSPETGGYFETVILRGENFGSDHKNIRVFFNQKEAIVVGASGDRILVHVPKLPGDDCKIKMLIGDNTDTIFSDKHFAYVKNYKLQYVAGQNYSNQEEFSEGSLQETIFGNQMNYLTCDSRGIVYVNHWGLECRGSLAYINESEHFTRFLCCGDRDDNAGECGAPYYDAITNKVYSIGRSAKGYFREIDPADGWSVVKRKLIAPNDDYKKKGYRDFEHVAANIGLRWANSMVRIGDFIYCRTFEGCLFRFNPLDRVYDVVVERLEYNKANGSSDVWMAADPDDPNKIYCTLFNLHRVTLIDLTKEPSDPSFETLVCGLPGVGGFQDGHASIARLNLPDQFVIMKDPENGNKVLYICDRQNQCVRKFDTVTKMMTTIVGTPGKWGYELRDSPTASIIDGPTGICISPEGDLYISTRYNHVLFKLSFL